MVCSVPPALSDEQLIAALEDEVDAAIKEHLAQCPECRGRLEHMRISQTRLKQKLFRWDCPSSVVLRDYALGLLAEAEHAAAERHINGCPRCQDELRLLDAFLNQDDSPGSVSAAASAAAELPRRRRPGELYAQMPPQDQAFLSAGWRGLEQERPIIAEFENAAVMLRFEHDETTNEWALAGVLNVADLDRWVGALVELYQENKLRTMALVDDFGAFRLRLKNTDSCSLAIISPHQVTLVIEDIAR